MTDHQSLEEFAERGRRAQEAVDMLTGQAAATSPAELWRQAGGGTPQYDPARYRQLMVQHGHLVPGEAEPLPSLPCGWQPDRPTKAAGGDRPLDGIGDLARALDGDDTSFTGELLRLIAKADPRNRARLRAAFPRTVLALELWQQLAPALTEAQLRQLLDSDPRATGPFDRLPPDGGDTGIPGFLVLPGAQLRHPHMPVFDRLQVARAAAHAHRIVQESVDHMRQALAEGADPDEAAQTVAWQSARQVDPHRVAVVAAYAVLRLAQASSGGGDGG